MLGALRGTARRAGRRAVRPAPPAAAAPPAGDDFDAARRRLGAELAYTPRFQSTAPAGEPERGLVAGAAIAWADDLQGMRLKRRAILRWDEGRPRRVLLVKKPADAAATAKLRDLGAWLTSHGVSVVVERAVAATDAPEFEAFDPGAPGGFEGEQSGGDGAESSSSSSSSSSASNASPPVDLAVSLGGDGTVLHLASLFAADAPLPPTLSFALGTLGFLTPFPAATARAVLSRLLWPPWPGEPVYCTLRSRRQCELWLGGALQRVHRVLNEAVIDRGASPAMALLELFVDGRHVTSVAADGLAIATPSGSTAYSLSAGGPMVAPSVPCTIVTPVAPHSLSFRPIVVPETSVLEVHLPEGARAAAARASFDGRHAARVRRGSSLVVRTCRFALPQVCQQPLDGDWYSGIVAKLRWSGSLRAREGFEEAPGR